MKIKTITCHNVYNTGASLQAYALAQYLRELGHDVEIIDYVPDYLTHYKLTGVRNSNYNKPILREIYQLLKLPGRIKARYGRRKAEFDRFTERYLPLTKEHYNSFEELCENPPQADLVFAGSDQIWNTLFKNGKDPSFYLQFLPKGCVRASYAASFATNDIASEWKTLIKKWLSEMDFISVRERTGLEILNKIEILNGVQVLDPVFLLSKEHWEKMAQQRLFSEEYIFLYDFDKRSNIGEYVKRMASKNGWKIYSFLKHPYADMCFQEEGPEMFLALIKGAQMVVSNSFHATAFSIIFEKQFVVFNRIEGINTRMKDLLEVVNLSECLIYDRSENTDVYIDYEKVQKCLNKVIINSKDYILRVISEVKNSD